MLETEPTTGNLGVILSARIDPNNPDHHIWNNNGTLWIHFTVIHHPSNRVERIRRSLRTKDRERARRSRDNIFAALPS